MYGEGTYKISFEVRGSDSSILKFGYSSDDADTALKTELRDVAIDNRWEDVEMKIFVTAAEVQADSVTFYVRMDGDTSLDYFEIRDFKLVRAE